MKLLLVGTLIAAVSFSGCQSTETEQPKNEVTNNTAQVIKQEKGEEAEAVVAKTNFTFKELQAAAKELGYRCVMHEVTGTRIKKKICSTKQQRKIRDEANRKFVQDMTQRPAVGYSTTK